MHVYALVESTLLEGTKNGSSTLEEPFFVPSSLLLRLSVLATRIFMQYLHIFTLQPVQKKFTAVNTYPPT